MSAKRVNFYKLSLLDSNENEIEFKKFKELMIPIIDNNGEKYNDFTIVDVSENDERIYADIFDYQQDFLFMRLSRQKPSNIFLHRDYETKKPDDLLGGASEEKEGVEVYTYVLLMYDDGIMSFVNLQGAPTVKMINNFFKKYNDPYKLKFVNIPNQNGISSIYEAKKPQISQIEIEIPVPDAVYLEKAFGWKDKDILDVQNGSLKASIKVSGIDRRVITHDGAETKKIIDQIKEKIPSYRKAKIRARSEVSRTQEYNFFDENFSYSIDIPSYKVVSGQRFPLTIDDLIGEYRENLRMSYNENADIFRMISNRTE